MQQYRGGACTFGIVDYFGHKYLQPEEPHRAIYPALTSSSVYH